MNDYWQTSYTTSELKHRGLIEISCTLGYARKDDQSISSHSRLCPKMLPADEVYCKGYPRRKERDDGGDR